MFSKKTAWILASIILFAISFTYAIFTKSDETSFYNEPYVQYSDLTTITQKEQWKQLNTTTGLLVKKKIRGNFIAKTDNLGIIAIPFNTHNRSINDRIYFRIKEAGSNNWFYQNIYKTNQFKNNIPFPFGFPIIQNSKNVSYTFEIESLNGTPDDSPSISKAKPYFLSKYKFPKSELVKNPYILSQFLVNKTVAQLPLFTFGEIISILLFSVFFPLLLYKVFNKIMHFFKTLKPQSVKSNFFTFIISNGVTILILLLFMIVGTDRFYNNLNQASPNKPTETRIRDYPSTDFNTSVYIRTGQMLKGEEMNVSALLPTVDSASGQLFPLLFSPFLLSLKPDIYVSYLFFIATTIAIFIIFYILLMRKSEKTISNGGLIFLIAFFLSEPGRLGKFQGNTDILLAPILGILLMLILNSIKEKKVSVFRIILAGILAGAIMNAKIFLLPFAILTIIFSKRIILTGIVTLATFAALIYAPNFWGSQSSLLLFLTKIIHWDNSVSISNSIWANHSIYAVASYFANCADSNTCDNKISYKLITLSLFLFTFIIPFLLNPSLRKSSLKKNKEFAILLFVLAVAFINLAFKVAYDYRLYFSIPVTLILFKETIKLKSASTYCYLSMFFLLFGGIWAISLTPNDPWTIDPRLLKIFFIFHFFFLILSSLVNWKESQVKGTLNMKVNKIPKTSLSRKFIEVK